MPLPRKQSNPDQASWIEALAGIRDEVSAEEVDRLVDVAATHTTEWAKRNGVDLSACAYGWSAGKDSQALRYVMDQVGVTECVLVISQLEVPEFLAWATDHMPDGLEVVMVDIDLDWLADHQETHLFPQGRHGSDWFRRVQHTGQRIYADRNEPDAMFLGRRSADGNSSAGSDDHGMHARTTQDWPMPRVAPIYDWSHEETFAAISHVEGLDLAPCYLWPRGFQVGTGPWPARQWTRDHDHGWSEIAEIDPRLVQMCLDDGRFPTAERWVERAGWELPAVCPICGAPTCRCPDRTVDGQRRIEHMAREFTTTGAGA